jgi:hypothetical protein
MAPRYRGRGPDHARVWRWHRFADAEWQHAAGAGSSPAASGCRARDRHALLHAFSVGRVPSPHGERLIQACACAAGFRGARSGAGCAHHAGAPARWRGAARLAPGARCTLRAIQRQAGCTRLIADDDAVRWHLKDHRVLPGRHLPRAGSGRAEAEMTSREHRRPRGAERSIVAARGRRPGQRPSAHPRDARRTRPGAAPEPAAPGGLLVDRGELRALTACDGPRLSARLTRGLREPRADRATAARRTSRPATRRRRCARTRCTRCTPCAS